MANDFLAAILGALEGFRSGFVPFQRSRYEDELARQRFLEQQNIREESAQREFEREKYIPTSEITGVLRDELDLPSPVVPAGRGGKQQMDASLAFPSFAESRFPAPQKRIRESLIDKTLQAKRLGILEGREQRLSQPKITSEKYHQSPQWIQSKARTTANQKLQAYKQTIEGLTSSQNDLDSVYNRWVEEEVEKLEVSAGRKPSRTGTQKQEKKTSDFGVETKSFLDKLFEGVK